MATLQAPTTRNRFSLKDLLVKLAKCINLLKKCGFHKKNALALTTLTLLSSHLQAQGTEYQRPLTAEESKIKQEYLSQQQVEKALKQECEKNRETEKICAGKEAVVLGQTIDSMVPVITKMLSTFGISHNGKMTKGKEAAPANGETEASPAKEGSDDHCKYIPLGGQVLTQVTMKSEQEAILNTPSGISPQAEAFYQQTRNHMARSKVAGMERNIWGATTACYLLYLTNGFSQLTTQAYIKIASSATIGTFYHFKEKAHKKFAKATRDIADQLPVQGDCNPITERNCYCSLEENMYDKQYCVPQAMAKRKSPTLPPDVTAGICVNSSLEADFQCHCSLKQNCADKNFRPLFSMEGFPLISTPTKRLIQNASEMMNGQIHHRLNGDEIYQNAFKKALEITEKNLPHKTIKIPLTERQKKLTKALMKASIPPKLARVLASNSSKLSTAKRTNSLAGKFSEKKRKTDGDVKGNRPSLSAIIPQTKKKVNSPNYLALLLKGKNRKPQEERHDFIEYAQKAQNRASINTDRKKTVFQIISHRYQQSGWKKT